MLLFLVVFRINFLFPFHLFLVNRRHQDVHLLREGPFRKRDPEDHARDVFLEFADHRLFKAGVLQENVNLVKLFVRWHLVGHQTERLFAGELAVLQTRIIFIFLLVVLFGQIGL